MDQVYDQATLSAQSSIQILGPVGSVRPVFIDDSLRDAGLEQFVDPILTKYGMRRSVREAYPEIPGDVLHYADLMGLSQGILAAHVGKGSRSARASMAFGLENVKPVVVLQDGKTSERVLEEYSRAVWIPRRGPDPGKWVEAGIQALSLLATPPEVEFVVPRSQQILTLQCQWDDVINQIARDSERLFVIHPRDFEELIAKLMEKEGYEVELTQETRDGGRDILCYRSDPMTDGLFLVETKRYARNRLVGIAAVQRFYGVATRDRANGSALITTSDFTKPARDWAAPITNQLSLRNFDFVKKWLRRHAGG